MTGDPWSPDQYRRFAAERRQPFTDLLALCRPVPGGRVVDLGCGTGELTAELHRVSGAAATEGVDASAAMLARAPRDVPGLSFTRGDLSAWDGPPADLVVANASFQWVGDHRALLGRVRAALRPGGQLAFQVPANYDHPSHRLVREVAGEEPFARLLGADPPPDRGGFLLAPEEYASVLYGLGARRPVVRLEVYGHELAGVDEVVEWVSGTLLTPYRARLEPDAYRGFVARYRERLHRELGDPRPYFYPFPRILAWATFP